MTDTTGHLRFAYVVDAHSHGFRLADLTRSARRGIARPGHDARGLPDLLGRARPRRPAAAARAHRLGSAEPCNRIRLAELLQCEATREAVSEARHTELVTHGTAYLQRLWEHADLRAMVVDDGYPLPQVDQAKMAEEAGIKIHRVVRIEPVIVRLREQAATYAELEDAFSAEIEQACTGGGAIAIKSVIAYRTGLDVAEWPRAEVEATYLKWAEAGFPETRELAKPVRDALLIRTLEVAKPLRKPVHIHCGGGDPSVVLAYARPKHLFPMLNNHRDQPIVLIHSGWPWLEEGAYVASILPRVYLETSINTAWASIIMDQKLEAVMGIAPTAKVMFGSDESSEPELAWISAIMAREALERVLSNAVERRWMTARGRSANRPRSDGQEL